MANEDWVRVRTKGGKGEYTIHRMSLESTPEAYEVLGKPAVDEVGQPLPEKPHVNPPKGKVQQSKEENS